MAFEEYDDYEQEQLVKEWLSKNWFTIFAGIALGIGGLWGYGKWQASQGEQNQAAAVEYAKLEQELTAGEFEQIEQKLAAYEAEFGQNIYTVKARLKVAGQMVEAGKTDEAKQQYLALIAAKPDKPIAEMARLRLSRLLVAEQDYVAALAQLDLVQSKAYQTIVDEITGDIHWAQGEMDKAKDAYQLALNEGEGYSGRQIVEMKLADVKTVK